MLPIVGIAAAGALVAGGAWLTQRRRSSQNLVTHLGKPFSALALPANGVLSLPTATVTAGQTALTRVTAGLVALEDRYQHFLQRRVDALLSGTRHAQWQEISGSHREKSGGGEGGAEESVLEISPMDREQNRRIARMAGVVVTGALANLYPPWLLLTIPLALYDWIAQVRWTYDELRRERRLKMEHLIVVFIAGLWLTGNFVIGGLSFMVYGLIFKMTLQTQDRTRKELVNILGEQPQRVWVLVDGVEMEVPFERLTVGDILVVQAGQMIPVDGVITQGAGAIDQHRLTGEAQPVEKGVGDPVLAATVVLSGRLQIRVEKTGEATLAAQIGEILAKTLDYHLSVEERGKAIADQWLAPSLAATGLAAVTLGLRSAVAVLSNMPGIDMVLLGPMTLLNYLNLASRNRVLIKDGRSLELLHKVDTVIFDKTGTLTLEQPHVKEIHLCADLEGDAVLTYAAAAEQRQSHPIAQAILAAARERALSLPAIADAHYELGYGLRVWLEVEDRKTEDRKTEDRKTEDRKTEDRETIQNPKSKIQNSLIRVGSERFMALEGIAVPPAMMAVQQACHDVGHSLVLVAVGEQLVGAVQLQPTIRPEAQAVIAALHQRKLATVIISGDQEAPTRKLAQELGIDRYFANVLPEGKAALVEGLQAEGRSVCFVGDGINDAIALKKAQVSVSLRGATTVATDTAQIVLMEQTLGALPTLIDLSHELERNLMTSLLLVTVPCVLVIGGVFFFHVGVPLAVSAYTATFAAGVTNAMSPMFRRRLPVVSEGREGVSTAAGNAAR
jgi:heavy metal translocating P-type ATPase